MEKERGRRHQHAPSRKKPRSALKKVQVSSLEVRNQRALLDGFNSREVTVQLARGSTVLRQKS